MSFVQPSDQRLCFPLSRSALLVPQGALCLLRPAVLVPQGALCPLQKAVAPQGDTALIFPP